MNGVSANRADKRRQIFRRAHPLEFGAGMLQSVGDAKPVGFVLVTNTGQELPQVAGMARPKRDIPLLLHRQAVTIPVAREQRLAGEERPDFGIARGLSLI